MGADRQLELAKNVHTLAKGLLNEGVKGKMWDWCGDFIVGEPSAARFNNRLQGFIIAERESMISQEEKEKNKLLGACSSYFE